MTRLAHIVYGRRRGIVVTWILLIVLGLFTTSKIGSRWFESFSIPGYSAYEANQRTLKTFGSGEQAPLVAVFRSNGNSAFVGSFTTARLNAASRPARGAADVPHG